MTEIIHCRPSQLERLVLKKIEQIRGRTIRAMNTTAVAAVPIIRSRTPKAFGELRDSAHSVPGANPKVVIDAPHAAAVERGSAPHTPDMEKLIAWVKLRGMQGLRNIRSARLHGGTTRDQARAVRDLLRKEVKDGNGGQFSPVDAAEQVARSIAKGIEQHGTPPHWFVLSSLPAIRESLHHNIQEVLKK